MNTGDRNGAGAFITLEGIDGSGKSSQAERLAEHLRARGRKVLVTFDPGGTPAGDEIRRVILRRDKARAVGDHFAEAFLYLASRRLLVTSVIRPALRAGTTVLCDRFTDSTLAYQGFGRGLPLDELERMCRLAADDLEPGLTLWLDLDPAAALSRVGRADRLESAGLEFQRRVREGYRFLAARAPERIKPVDASGTPEEIFRLVRRAVEGFFDHDR